MPRRPVRSLTTHYRPELAFIHDAGFNDLARSAAHVLIDALHRAGFERGLVIDLGCGSGVLAAEAAANGFDVLGIDISSDMVEIAQQRVPNGRFRAESLFKARLEPCVAVTAVGECLNYLFDRRNSDVALTKVFARVYDALMPGGVFLLDVATPGRVRGSGIATSHAQGDGWAVLATSEEDRARKRLTRRITSFRQVGDLYRKDEEVHKLRLLDRADVIRWLRKAGFVVSRLTGYGSCRFATGYAEFLARKPR
jgi:SAM-dependent methyltransferase